jgi:hypothetical protein
MLKKIHILFILNILLISSIAFSQGNVRFKRFYDLAPYTWGSYSMNVTTLSDGYLLSGIVLDTADNYLFNRLLLLKVDTLGNPVWEKRYGNRKFQYVQDGWKMELKNNALYFSTIVVKLDSAKNTTVFIKFNLNGDSLWGKEYDYLPVTTSNTWFALFGRCNTPDGGFAFSGHKSNGTVGDNGIVLLKTDSLGNEEWRSVMNTAPYYSSGGTPFFDTVTQKYIIPASHNPPGAPDELQGIIIIADINGNKLNQYSLTVPYGGGVGEIIQTPDNNFIAAGKYNTNETIGFLRKSKHWAVKFNISGTFVWSKFYSVPSVFNWISSPTKLPDGNIALIGSFDTLYNQSLPFNSHFYVQKIDQNGDSLWARSINMINGDGVQNNVTSIDLTSDNGLVLTGYFFGGVPNNEIKFCIAKLDEWGCDTLDCQLVSINEPQKPKFDFLLYPNPANENLNISILGNELPEFYQIIDITGKILRTEKINSSHFTINTSTLPPAVYTLYVFNKNRPAVSKRFSVTH